MSPVPLLAGHRPKALKIHMGNFERLSLTTRIDEWSIGEQPPDYACLSGSLRIPALRISSRSPTAARYRRRIAAMLADGGAGEFVAARS
jgi:hypothetical protein